MHILILNWRDPYNPKYGGAEIVTLEHAKFWLQQGHKVTWFTAKFKNSKSEEIINGVEIVRRGNWFTVYILAFFFYFFSGKKFDFVIDEFHGLPYFTPLFVRKPKIAFIHEVAEDIWDYMYPFPISKIGKNFEKLFYIIYRNAVVWCDAESTVDDLVRYGIKRENCHVIHCPINNKALKRLPVKEKDPTFIFCSRVVRMKGLENVINAFNLITKKMENAKLWVVGGGDEHYIEEMKKLIESFGIEDKVKFYGRVSNEEKLSLMKRSHIMLLAMTVHGGWGLVIIEAASQATPSVVYKVSGICDAVRNKITGIVVTKNSPQVLADEAIKLYFDKNRYKLYQENCLEWVESLTWEKAVKQSIKIIESQAAK